MRQMPQSRPEARVPSEVLLVRRARPLAASLCDDRRKRPAATRELRPQWLPVARPGVCARTERAPQSVVSAHLSRPGIHGSTGSIAVKGVLNR